MSSVFSDVAAFMRVAQRDYMASSPRAPAPGDLDARDRLYTASAMAARSVRELKKNAVPDAVEPTRLAAQLMIEELGETLEAMADGDLVAFADGLADLQYVIQWAALAHGIDLEAVHEAVHAANMKKFPLCESCRGHGHTCEECDGAGRVVLRDASGKIQKPPSWTPPDIASVLASQSPLRSDHPTFVIPALRVWTARVVSPHRGADVPMPFAFPNPMTAAVHFVRNACLEADTRFEVDDAEGVTHPFVVTNAGSFICVAEVLP